LSSKKTTVPYEAAKPSTFECDLFFCSSSLNSCFCERARGTSEGDGAMRVRDLTRLPIVDCTDLKL